MRTLPATGSEIGIDTLEVSAYRVPTDEPESDGTLTWDATTIVIVEVGAGGRTGLGYTYGDLAVATFADTVLASAVQGADALAPPAAWEAMRAAARNAGQPGVGAMAVAAVDLALWDLAARIAELPLSRLLGMVRADVPVYGSGGFTSYSLDRLTDQLADWVAAGIPRVKMKIGRHPGQDPRRLDVVRAAVGDAELMVDANGAYSRVQAD